MVGEGGRCELMLWNLAKLTLVFLQSLGLIAVRATNADPAKVTLKGKEGGGGGSLMCLLLVKVKGGAAEEKWSKLSAALFRFSLTG